MSKVCSMRTIDHNASLPVIAIVFTLTHIHISWADNMKFSKWNPKRGLQWKILQKKPFENENLFRSNICNRRASSGRWMIKSSTRYFICICTKYTCESFGCVCSLIRFFHIDIHVNSSMEKVHSCSLFVIGSLSFSVAFSFLLVWAQIDNKNHGFYTLTTSVCETICYRINVYLLFS